MFLHVANAPIVVRDVVIVPRLDVQQEGYHLLLSKLEVVDESGLLQHIAQTFEQPCKFLNRVLDATDGSMTLCSPKCCSGDAELWQDMMRGQQAGSTLKTKKA